MFYFLQKPHFGWVPGVTVSGGEAPGHGSIPGDRNLTSD